MSQQSKHWSLAVDSPQLQTPMKPRMRALRCFSVSHPSGLARPSLNSCPRSAHNHGVALARLPKHVALTRRHEQPCLQQKRSIFNMFSNKWKKPYKYVVDEEGVTYMKGYDTVAAFKFADVNKIGIRHESHDNRSLYLQWAISINGSSQILLIPYDEELPGHAELLERLTTLPNFQHRAYASAMLSRRASPDGMKLVHLVWEKAE